MGPGDARGRIKAVVGAGSIEHRRFTASIVCRDPGPVVASGQEGAPLAVQRHRIRGVETDVATGRGGRRPRNNGTDANRVAVVDKHRGLRALVEVRRAGIDRRHIPDVRRTEAGGEDHFLRLARGSLDGRRNAGDEQARGGGDQERTVSAPDEGLRAGRMHRFTSLVAVMPMAAVARSYASKC